MLSVLVLLLIVGTGYLIIKFSGVDLTVLLKIGGENVIVDKKVDSVFGEASLSYVRDPEVGLVLGEDRYNETAGKFDALFHLESARSEDISKIYKRYSITSMNGGVVKGVLLGASDTTEFILECNPGQSALFKSKDMRFVSANMNVTEELRIGDTLFTKCVTEVCDRVGPECIIIRFVQPDVSP